MTGVSPCPHCVETDTPNVPHWSLTARTHSSCSCFSLQVSCDPVASASDRCRHCRQTILSLQSKDHTASRSHAHKQNLRHTRSDQSQRITRIMSSVIGSISTRHPPRWPSGQGVLLESGRPGVRFPLARTHSSCSCCCPQVSCHPAASASDDPTHCCLTQHCL